MIAVGRHTSRPAGPRKRARGVIKADINVTPLVDVVLVLLIIFMVVTPMLSKGINVDLPVTQHHDKRSDDNKDVVIAITHLGQIYLGSKVIPLEQLGDAVTSERRRHPDKGVLLKGDARLDYGHARRVMEAIHHGGIERIQLGTEEAATGGAEPNAGAAAAPAARAGGQP
jgi:biopolymer transport protein ExbD/biopolymer transport protein TolR